MGALISPWPPSPRFLHSGGTDEMKSDGKRERRETVRDGELESGVQYGKGGREGRQLKPPAKSLLTLNSLVCQPLL